MGMLKIWFWRQNAKIHFSHRNGKTPLQFFFILIVCYRCLTKAKKIWKKSFRLRRRPLYVDFALFGLFGTFDFFLANIQIFTRQALCFHPYRPWVGSVTPKKVTETKCSKLDPQKELIDPKMAIKVPKVPTKSFFLHRLSQMSSNEWIITKKLKSETLHPKRVPFHPELPSVLYTRCILHYNYTWAAGPS